MSAWELGAVVAVALYNLCVLAGTCYLIVAHGWSPWWLALALVCLKSLRTGKAAGDDDADD